MSTNAFGAAQVPHRRDLPSLTGLRFLAAAAVVFCHTTDILGAGTVTEQFARLGYVGVEFFFILSGFVLAWSWDPSVDKKTFYRRRFARIYPLYIVTWVGVVLAAEVFRVPDRSMVGAVLGIFMIQAWFPQQEIFQAGNTPGWSLSAEAFFYALFPFLVRRLPRSVYTTPVLVVSLTAAGCVYGLSDHYSVWFAYYSPIYGLLYFVTGMTLVAQVRAERTLIPSLRSCLALLACSFFALALFAHDESKGFVEALMLPSIVMLIVAAARTDVSGSRTLWGRPFLVALGQWSFGLYLVHFGLLGIVKEVAPTPLGAAATLVCTVGFLAIATIVAACVYYTVERPAERIIRGRRQTRVARRVDIH